jgi:hypothetical protein
LQGFHEGEQAIGQRHGSARPAIDVDMDEAAVRRGLGRAGGEDADLVGNAGAADPRDRQAGLERLRDATDEKKWQPVSTTRPITSPCSMSSTPAATSSALTALSNRLR